MRCRGICYDSSEQWLARYGMALGNCFTYKAEALNAFVRLQEA